MLPGSFSFLARFDSGTIDESHAKACRSEGSRASHNDKLNQKTPILKNRNDQLSNDTDGLGEKTTFHHESLGNDEGRTDFLS